LDINKIFGKFGSSSKDEGFDYSPSTFNTPFAIPSEDDENHPVYYIKRFETLILNSTSYHDQLLSFFDKSSEELDLEEIKSASKRMLYEGAFTYLKKIDLQDEYHLKILSDQTTPQLEIALNKAIKYNEENEEYEKCAFLKEFLDFLNFSSYLNNKKK
jgi:hypothetical protein|tara:strand:- start:328 stop:801 length:474 start_codon:yes stop_codon:yes gene_type:complete